MTRPTLAITLLVAGHLLPLSQQAEAHDPYTGRFSFGGANCCTGKDCDRVQDPRDFKSLPNGSYLIKSTGEIIPYLDTGFSPDANWHICRKSDTKKTVRCLLIPGDGT